MVYEPARNADKFHIMKRFDFWANEALSSLDMCIFRIINPPLC